MVSTAFIVFNLIFSIYVHGTQFRQFGRIKKLFHKFRKLTANFDRWLPMDEVNYLPQLAKFTLRTFFFSIVYESYHLFSVSFVAPNKFSICSILAFVLPNFIVKFYPDIFYGGMLVAHFYFHQMNKEVKLILNTAIEQKSSWQENMNVITALSEKLENVAVHYFQLIEIVKEFNSITSFRVLLWLFILLLNFVVHLFMQYVFVGVSLQHGQKINVAISITGLIDTMLQLFEFWLTTSICSRLSNEISQTEIMLSSMYLHLRHSDHVQFKEKMFMIANRIKHENLEITGSKLFVIDSRLIFAIISSTFSYLMILIQFEL
ncbi:uncharacterized protein LOC119067794 [Bradysia coprophila]|uniref:uncharacterized protein LOC119067794 n=1 Tax=Bradysia coprophila TaxID=38358 RepID=UPI00187D9D59|nr:uncharacterized protein LOC119067794 [Bradysia coprophila]